MTRALPLALALVLSACAARYPQVPGPLSAMRSAPPRLDQPVDLPVAKNEGSRTSGTAAAKSGNNGDKVAAAASHYLDHRPKGFRDDCSGFACAVYTRAGYPLNGNTQSIWEDAEQKGQTHKRKVPNIGDLAFFDNTYDRNGNGRRDDDLTHIAVVIDLEADGTIVLAHGGTSRGRTTLRMNLKHPKDTELDGVTINQPLRSASARGDSGPVLASQLWRGFATLEPAPISMNKR